MKESKKWVCLAKKGRKQDLNKVKEFINNKDIENEFISAYIDYCESDGKRIIHIVSETGSIEWFIFILEFAEKYNRLDELIECETLDKQNIPHFIVKNPDESTAIAMLRIIEEHNGFLDSPDIFNQTPLHYAVRYSKHKLIYHLSSTFEHQRDNNGFTAIDYAILLSDLDALSILIEEINWNTCSTTYQARYIQCACISGDISCFNYLINELEIDIQVIDPRNGRNCLHYAVLTSNIDLAFYLSKPKLVAIINQGDKTKRTPLHLAASENNVNACARLLEHNANPMLVDCKNLTCFHYASIANGDSLRFLLSNISKDHFNEFSVGETLGRSPKMTCLHIASYRRQEISLSLLLNELGDSFNPNILDKYRNSVLYYCVLNQMKESFLTIIRIMKTYNLQFKIEKQCNIIHYMIKNNWESEYFIALKSVCNPFQYENTINKPNSDGVYPVHIATACGNIQFLYSKIENLAKIIDKNGNTCAHYASFYNQNKCLNVIQGRYVNCLKWENKLGQKPIVMAYANGCSSIIKSFNEDFIEYLNHTDNNGNNLLHLSCFTTDPQYIQVLIKTIPPNSVNNIGQGLLHRIILSPANSISIFEYVIQLKDSDSKPLFNINLPDGQGCTPLHLLCLNQTNTDYLLLLLKYNANINVKDNDGNTPLHYCAYLNKVSYLKILLKQNDILPYLSNIKKRIPLDTAAFFGNSKIIKKLLKYSQLPDIIEDYDSIIDITGRSPIHAAALSGDIESLILLSDYFNINMKNGNNQTPLTILFKHKDKYLIEEFISLGVIISQKEREYLIKHGWIPNDDNNNSENNEENHIIDDEEDEEDSIEEVKIYYEEKLEKLEIENSYLREELLVHQNDIIHTKEKEKQLQLKILSLIENIKQLKSENKILTNKIKQKDKTIEHISSSAYISIEKWKKKYYEKQNI